MQQEPKTESADRCPKCSQPMEPVFFNFGPTGFVLRQGKVPTGFLAQTWAALTRPFVRADTGNPVEADAKQGYNMPGMHCKHCRQITISYTS